MCPSGTVRGESRFETGILANDGQTAAAGMKMRPMRRVALFAGLLAAALLGGCDATPESLGITGPGQRPTPSFAPDDTVLRPPGLPDPNTGSGPEQRYYHYN